MFFDIASNKYTSGGGGVEISADNKISVKEADLGQPGVVSTGEQEFEGFKKFTDGIGISGLLELDGKSPSTDTSYSDGYYIPVGIKTASNKYTLSYVRAAEIFDRTNATSSDKFYVIPNKNNTNTDLVYLAWPSKPTFFSLNIAGASSTYFSSGTTRGTIEGYIFLKNSQSNGSTPETLNDFINAVYTSATLGKSGSYISIPCSGYIELTSPSSFYLIYNLVISSAKVLADGVKISSTSSGAPATAEFTINDADINYFLFGT